LLLTVTSSRSILLFIGDSTQTTPFQQSDLRKTKVNARTAIQNVRRVTGTYNLEYLSNILMKIVPLRPKMIILKKGEPARLKNREL